ncbi:hypothetical protein G6011_10937 [Alternaria panax]|uniref:Uncharacterized protein n=1 Tax=Alternaria panax TaxID=48097 RepID=A0AAD4NQP5_9PLEO|nr:hypothetical protein G6011_10937 [Alternaria panax]
MDAKLKRQPITPNPPKELRRWNYDEETRLLHLIKVENKTYKEAAIAIHRSTQSVQHRYSIIQQRDESATITWTSKLDAAIIDGRRRGLTLDQIAQEINLPDKAIQSRWQTLRATKKVPEDVLALRRRKPLRDFIPQEDEAILKLYIEGKDDKEIATAVGIEGRRSQTEIITRRRKLVAESSLVYRRLIQEQRQETGIEHSNNKERMDTLELAVSRNKYSWMNEGDREGGAALD